jgi:hypothetical protein
MADTRAITEAERLYGNEGTLPARGNDSLGICSDSQSAEQAETPMAVPEEALQLSRGSVAMGRRPSSSGKKYHRVCSSIV